MKSARSLAPLIQNFFLQRLVQQKQASPNTISSYRDTFRLLFRFLEKHLGKAPSQLSLEDVEAPLIVTFLNGLEKDRGIGPRTRNLRLTAIRSFFRYVAFEVPENASQIQRVLAIPDRRCPRALVGFLSRPEAGALLAAPDASTWSGRRDHALMLLALQTGLRLSEITGLKKEDINLQCGRHVRVVGKGRKERCTPLARRTAMVLRAWLNEPSNRHSAYVFPNARGGRFSADGVQYLLAKHVGVARSKCPTLADKDVTCHVLRHTAAMELLLAGVDRAVIALWLGHESVETTQVYLDANLAIKEEALAKTSPIGGRLTRYKPDDTLMAFLKAL